MSTRVREAFFSDWSPDREENPNGIQDLVDHPVPVMRNPDEEWDTLRAALPGEDPHEFNPLWDGENPYSVMAPSKLRAFLNDPEVKGMQRKRVVEAYMRLQRLESGGQPEAREEFTEPPLKRHY